MLRLFRWTLSLASFAALFYFAATVDLGGKTLVGHLGAIFRTPEARALASGTADEAGKVAERVRQAVAAAQVPSDGTATGKTAPGSPTASDGTATGKALAGAQAVGDGTATGRALAGGTDGARAPSVERLDEVDRQGLDHLVRERSKK